MRPSDITDGIIGITINDVLSQILASMRPSDITDGIEQADQDTIGLLSGLQ